MELVIGKHRDNFFCKGGGFLYGDLRWGEKYLGVEYSTGNATRRRFDRITNAKFFLIVLYSLCHIFHVEMFQGNYPGALFCVF